DRSGGSLELYVARERLAEPPSGANDVGEDERLAIGDGDPEGEALAGEVGQRVPLGAPVVRHGHPVRRLGALHVHGLDRAGRPDVGQQHQLEVVVPVDGEPHPALLHARNPLVDDGDDAAAVDADLLPGGLGHVEVGARRVAPAAAVAGEVPVGRAEVGGGDGDGDARLAPRPVRLAVADELVALPAGEAVVEQRRAERRRPRA
ncbi:hypothetical protein EE612_010298, partial [Oryza sativa]